MRILIVGAGALGGYFGARLHHAGRDVTFLVRPPRAVQLQRLGLRVQSPHGNIDCQVRAATTADLSGQFDLVLLAVKAYSLAQGMEDLAPAMQSSTAVIPVINGIAHIDQLSARFGAHRVLGGVATISATLDPDGKVIQLLPVHELVFGELGGGRSERVQAIADALAGAGFDSRLSENIMQDMWEKWAALATNAGITCLMRAAIGDIVAAVSGTETIARLFHECCSVAEASGYRPREAFAERWLSSMTAPGSPLKASMLRDIEAGARTEGEHVLGDMLVRAEKARIPTPVLSLARTHVAAYEARRMREAAASSAHAV